MPKETSRLLESWRAAARAAEAARTSAEHAQIAAEAAALAAEAARVAAEDAGVTVEAADQVATGAAKAFHDREEEIIAVEEKRRSEPMPGGLGEPT